MFKKISLCQKQHCFPESRYGSHLIYVIWLLYSMYVGSGTWSGMHYGSGYDFTKAKISSSCGSGSTKLCKKYAYYFIASGSCTCEVNKESPGCRENAASTNQAHQRCQPDPQATQLDPSLAQHRSTNRLTAVKKCIFLEQRPNLVHWKNNVACITSRTHKLITSYTKHSYIRMRIR